MIENTVLFISNYFVYSVCYLFIVQLLCFYPESQAKWDRTKSDNTVQIFNILNKSSSCRGRAIFKLGGGGVFVLEDHEI